jgi:hypothetical protein
MANLGKESQTGETIIMYYNCHKKIMLIFEMKRMYWNPVLTVSQRAGKPSQQNVLKVLEVRTEHIASSVDYCYRAVRYFFKCYLSRSVLLV